MPDYNDLAYTLAGTNRRANPYDAKRRFASQMLQSGTDYSPVAHPLQGAARLAQALVGGWIGNRADADEKQAAKDRTDKLTAAMSETDPQKRIGLLTAVDPELGARLSGQLAIEQAKSAQQREGLNAVAGTYGAPQPSGPIGAGPPLPTSTPNASGFNNNLGNIRVSGANWQGKGAPHNGFETFNTPQDGANAMFGNLGAYVKANPSMTVAQAISKWAPPNENDTNLYIRQVMESTGINPAMPLSEVLQDPALAATLMDAMTRKEKGGLPQGVTADTFMTATTPRGAPTGPPQPLQVNMPGPGPQGAADTNGMPPTPSPQGVTGPTMSAPPVPPQRMTPRDMPPQMAAPFVDRLRRGGYGTNPAEAEQRMVADMQRALDVSFENQKLEYERLRGDYEYGRKRGDEAPQKQFDNSNKLRDEFNGSKVVQNYREVTPIMESMKDAVQRPSRAADLNMVYALAKIMDPGSVVREGEMIMVNNTQGIGDRLAGMINSLNGGAQLTPETRQRIIEEAQSRYKGLESSYKALEDHYGGMSDRFGLRREDVIVPIRKPAAEGGNAPAAGGGQRQRISLDGKPL
jgi:hypothetical protein